MAGSPPGWAALQGAIGGEVVLHGSAAYERVHTPFNARFDPVRPQAVVLCTTPEDVAETISFARRHGLEMATRSGGHCFAGRSLSPGVVIDVTRQTRCRSPAGWSRSAPARGWAACTRRCGPMT
jgi:FAD/FMN-containing dehydrogenase